jgi:hypothetical protein
MPASYGILGGAHGQFRLAAEVGVLHEESQAPSAINQRLGAHMDDVAGRFRPITSGYFTFQIYAHWNGGAPTRRCRAWGRE